MYQFKPATERIQQQRELIRDRVVRYDAERGRIMTEAYQKYEHVIPIISAPWPCMSCAGRWTILVEDFELIVGNKGPNYFSSPAYPEWGHHRLGGGRSGRRQMDASRGRPVP